MSFKIIRNDITKVKADAIVNTANPYVTIGSGVDSAIYEAAGKEKLLKEREKIGVLLPGQVGITPGFNLDAKYIIHASGPAWVDGKRGEKECLRMCYDLSLLMAEKYGLKSIAFPLLATGSYGFPKETGIQIAVESFTSFLEEYEMEILLVVFGKEATSISGKIADEVKSFIDDTYVEKAIEKEYPGQILPTCGTSRFASRRETVEIENVLSSCDLSISMEECSRTPESLEEALKSIYTDSFEKHLQKTINKKGFKNSEVYARANISKQYFSKLINGQVKPSKEKLLALAVGLELNLDETVDFLGLAGYALSPISQTDKVVEYFIKKRDYNVLKIDIVLFDYGLDPLS